MNAKCTEDGLRSNAARRRTATRGARQATTAFGGALLLGVAGCGSADPASGEGQSASERSELGAPVSGTVHHRIPVYFIRMVPNSTTPPPISDTRAVQLVMWANEVYLSANVQFYLQGTRDVVMPNFADVSDKNAEVPWSQVWQELSQVANVTASTYPSDKEEKLGDWLNKMYSRMPLNRANVWLASGASMWNDASRLGSSIRVRKNVQEDNKYNFAHELGHYLNLVHTHVSTSAGLVEYPTPPLLDDDPDDPCILWDSVYVRRDAAQNPAGHNLFFASRGECQVLKDAYSIPNSGFRSMLPHGDDLECPAACVGNHSDPSCSSINGLCWYEANTSTDEVGRYLHGEWYEGDDVASGSSIGPLTRGVARQQSGVDQWAYNIMAYSDTHSWNNPRFLSDSLKEIVRDTSFRYRHRPQMTCFGHTDSTATRWVQYNDDGIYTDVDTSLCGLETPLYFTSLGGDGQHWYTTGATSIYSPTANGFRVYVNRPGVTVAQATSNHWHVNWVAHPKDARGPELCTGNTSQTSSNWKDYATNGIYLDVDTSACSLDTTPIYLTSLGGTSRHWKARGATSIYSPTPTGFRVYVQDEGLTAATAKNFDWHINWKAVSRRTGGGCGGKTVPSAWQAYTSDGIYVDVALSTECRALAIRRDVLRPNDTTTLSPYIFTSLGGDTQHWLTRGATSIYSPTSTGFRVYVQRDGITPAEAEANGWYINWVLQP